MGRSRSAEQTARVLLSNAVRHDTWECRASKDGAVDPLLTLRLVWDELPLESPFNDAVALHVTLFDRVSSAFIGATYTAPRLTVTDPLIFQSRGDNILLVVEVVARDERPHAPVEGRRVVLWGYLPVAGLSAARFVALRPGNAQLLYLNPKSWPSGGDEMPRLGYTCTVVEDAVVSQLMTRLVPPGILVPQSFTESAPQASAGSFRCVVQNIQVTPTVEDAEWDNGTAAEWRIAAVAHNGYQQLGQGAEVSLELDNDDGVSPSTSSGAITTTTTATTTSGPSAATTANNNNSSSSSNHHHHHHGALRRRLLRSVAPLEIDGLPVHSATSLVLAIRRKKLGGKRFEVLGFCVFPLCVMPVKDRDLRVENLPTLHGPFSCRDPRMLMLESTSPYGKVPMTVTLTVEYYDTGSASLSEPHSLTQWKPVDVEDTVKPAGESEGRSRRRKKTKESVLGENEQVPSAPFVPASQPLGIISTEDSVEPPAGEAATTSSAAALQAVELTYPADALGKQTAEDHSPIDIFKMLCNVMEELRRLREVQEEVMRHGRPRGVPAQRVDETGRQLDDVTGFDVVDLAPKPVSISWEVRCQLEENLQPILHPLHGTRLDDHVPATGSMTASLYGIRFEGLTVDASIYVPDDVCFMFSFGPLPFQTIGPVRAARIDKSLHVQTFKLYEGTQRGGMVWCEPLEGAQDTFLQKYHKQGTATLYIHIYDALTMFYIGSADVLLAHFRRPHNAESARISMDLALYRDLSLTERTVPAKVLPIMRHAGQMHVTLFCVGTSGPAELHVNTTVEPPRGSRVVVAKKLPHASLMESLPGGDARTEAVPEKPREEGQAPPVVTAPSAPEAAAVEAAVEATQGGDGDQDNLHWRRAQYVKQLYGNSTTLPGVPHEHPLPKADLEFRLRYLEKQRDEMKSRKIAEALMERLTVHHHVYVASCRPETTRTVFQNPFGTAMQFSVEVDSAAAYALEVASPPSFYLGPHEQTDVLLVVRLAKWKGQHGEPLHLRACVYTDGREVVRIVDVQATMGPPFVDRRYEIFGPAGAEVSKKVFSRLFSSSTFPITSDRAKLLARMRDVCGRATITSESTTADVNAVLDPITQSYVTAWEEVTLHTTIPRDGAAQRVEYLTLFEDAAMSKVIETWELCIFACQAVTSRELRLGQTTTVALPAAGVEALYCSGAHVKVERRENSYLLHLRPQEVGTQQLLLHALTNQQLAKTLLTVPTVYPAPTYTQMLELSLADTTAPIFRRLQFVHNGTMDEVFTVHHNYKYQLQVTPKQFALAPNDSQFITMQIDMLSLPEGQMEGRWPMWIFVNNASDKTVVSYLIQVVLRAHRVIHDMS
ncbi:putative dynein heavy chain [Trypanosoma grayi]|uniref:putative dynein heavy chain n=1 Tax=Trypanosoma grayi TaxID=71804 RepID=UPI0004F3FF6A|nr:putative dynein heavy chain [Trypanosoma grayi]KEG11296.1 putative dynein heavy chain [Trypanosoma grayi]